MQPVRQIAYAENGGIVVNGNNSTIHIYQDRHQQPADVPAPDVQVCPYRGLESFGTEHAAWFAGRDDEVKAIAEAVEAQSLTGLIAASGAGKSSLVYAGLIPALAARDAEHWDVFAFRPGDEPLVAMFSALTRVLDEASDNDTIKKKARSRAADLTSGTLPLRDHIAGLPVPANSAAQHRVLIIVDQFEELYTQSSQKDREVLIRELLDITERGLAKVLLTMRFDFMEAMSDQDKALFKRVMESPCYLTKMDDTGIREAIRLPAEAVDLEVPEELASLLIADTADQPGFLPYLQFALRQLWLERDIAGSALTVDEYYAMGRLNGAIGRHASSVYDGLTDKEQILAKVILPRLVSPGDHGTDLSRRQLLKDFDADSQALLRKLAEPPARLVVLSSSGEDTGADEDITVEFAHEALIREWGELQDWMAERQDFYRLRDKLEDEGKNWDAHSQNPDLLIRPVKPLADAENLAENARPGDLSARLSEYISASVEKKKSDDAKRQKAVRAQREADKLQLNRLRTRNRGLLALTAVFVAATIGAIYFANESYDAQQLAEQAQTETTEALKAETLAKERATALQQAEAKARELAETALAEREKALAAERDAVAAEEEQRKIAELARKNAEERASLLSIASANQLVEEGEVDAALRTLIDASEFLWEPQDTNYLHAVLEKALHRSVQEQRILLPADAIARKVGDSVLVYLSNNQEMYQLHPELGLQYLFRLPEPPILDWRGKMKLYPSGERGWLIPTVHDGVLSLYLGDTVTGLTKINFIDLKATLDFDEFEDFIFVNAETAVVEVKLRNEAPSEYFWDFGSSALRKRNASSRYTFSVNPAAECSERALEGNLFRYGTYNFAPLTERPLIFAGECDIFGKNLIITNHVSSSAGVESTIYIYGEYSVFDTNNVIETNPEPTLSAAELRPSEPAGPYSQYLGDLRYEYIVTGGGEPWLSLKNSDVSADASHLGRYWAMVASDFRKVIAIASDTLGTEDGRRLSTIFDGLDEEYGLSRGYEREFAAPVEFQAALPNGSVVVMTSSREIETFDQADDDEPIIAKELVIISPLKLFGFSSERPSEISPLNPELCARDLNQRPTDDFNLPDFEILLDNGIQIEIGNTNGDVRKKFKLERKYFGDDTCVTLSADWKFYLISEPIGDLEPEFSQVRVFNSNGNLIDARTFPFWTQFKVYNRNGPIALISNGSTYVSEWDVAAQTISKIRVESEFPIYRASFNNQQTRLLTVEGAGSGEVVGNEYDIASGLKVRELGSDYKWHKLVPLEAGGTMAFNHSFYNGTYTSYDLKNSLKLAKNQISRTCSVGLTGHKNVCKSLVDAFPAYAWEETEVIYPEDGYYWLQLASRNTMSEAIDFAQNILIHWPELRIFRATNGKFAIAADIFGPEFGNQQLRYLLSMKLIPDDSYFVTGSSYETAYRAIVD